MIKTIFSLVTGIAPVLLLAAAGGCDFDIFEKVNNDPHPPAILNLQYGPQVIRSGEIVTGSFTYVDEGQDIDLLEMRDQNGAESLQPTTPAEPTFDEDGNLVVDEDGNPVLETSTVFFFPGATGTIEWQVQIETNQAGTHTIKVWLEDATGSLSDPAFMDVEVIF